MKKIRIGSLMSCLMIVFLCGCTSPYIGKSRVEIVKIIAQEYKKSPEEIHIHVPRGSNYHFNHPSEILDENRGWGPDMTKYDQWGIFPHKKLLYDGRFCTLLTFKDNIVIKDEEFYCGGYGFYPLVFIFLLFAPLFFMNQIFTKRLFTVVIF